MNKMFSLTAIIFDHAGRESVFGREVGNNEFSWNGLIAQ